MSSLRDRRHSSISLSFTSIVLGLNQNSIVNPTQTLIFVTLSKMPVRDSALMLLDLTSVTYKKPSKFINLSQHRAKRLNNSF
jgi:hypothetical protein